MSLNYDNYNNAFNKAWKGANSMDPLSAGAIASGVIAGASAIGSGITGLVNNEYNKKQNEWNKQFAREQWEYQKYANENAVQIRARDLEAAGLSKQLAAGSASGNVDLICKKMAIVPSWAEGLILRADGYETKYYKKD